MGDFNGSKLISVNVRFNIHDPIRNSGSLAIGEIREIDLRSDSMEDELWDQNSICTLPKSGT